MDGNADGAEVVVKEQLNWQECTAELIVAPCDTASSVEANKVLGR